MKDKLKKRLLEKINPQEPLIQVIRIFNSTNDLIDFISDCCQKTIAEVIREIVGEKGNDPRVIFSCPMENCEISNDHFHCNKCRAQDHIDSECKVDNFEIVLDKDEKIKVVSTGYTKEEGN